MIDKKIDIVESRYVLNSHYLNVGLFDRQKNEDRNIDIVEFRFVLKKIFGVVIFFL